MKYIIIIIFGFTGCNLFGQAECIDGLGHVKYRDLYSLRDTTGLTYSFDTTYTTTTIDEVDYVDTLEWVIVPAGWDTIVWRCERCDSIQFQPSDTVRILSRQLFNPMKPEVISVLDSIPIISVGVCEYIRRDTILTSSGTWTKPDGLIMLEVVCIGGGSGGSSGAKRAAGVASLGGGGGNGGVISQGVFLASELDATEVYTVGGAGSGGVSVTANTTANNSGNAGGNTYFGGTNLATSLVFAAGGKAPSLNSGAIGAVWSDQKPITVFVSCGGASANGSGGAGISTTNQGNIETFLDIYGGGAGGGVNASNAASAGSSGARYYNRAGTLSNDNKGAIGTDGTDGANYYMNRIPFIMGAGVYEDIAIGYGTPGGGGGSSVTGNAGKGGNGGLYGGAGGGGGAARNDVGNSGAGGNGAAGVIILIEHIVK